MAGVDIARSGLEEALGDERRVVEGHRAGLSGAQEDRLSAGRIKGVAGRRGQLGDQVSARSQVAAVIARRGAAAIDPRGARPEIVREGPVVGRVVANRQHGTFERVAG